MDTNGKRTFRLALYLGVFFTLSLWIIGCDRLGPSTAKTNKPKILSVERIEPTEISGRFKLVHVDAKVGDGIRTFIFRIDSTNGRTWQLDLDSSKWVFITSSDPKDPLGIREQLPSG